MNDTVNFEIMRNGDFPWRFDIKTKHILFEKEVHVGAVDLFKAMEEITEHINNEYNMAVTFTIA